MEEIIIIGAGQAGLAVAYHLTARGLAATVVDRADRIGNGWRRRYDSLRLFTPAQYSSLHGWPMPLGHDVYPAKDEVADYLEAYAERQRMAVVLGVEVRRVAQHGSAFMLDTSKGEIQCSTVVVATGGLGHPRVPSFAAEFSNSVRQIHSCDYRNPVRIGPGSVLVVGAGNSGAQIAAELSASRDVAVAFDRMPKRLPQRLLGRDIFWWLIRFGVLDRSVPPQADVHEVVGAIPLIGSSLPALLRSGSVHRRPRVVSARHDEIVFADDSCEHFDTVIWATGFTVRLDWIDIDGIITDGRLQHTRGVSSVLGLYFIGLPGLATKGSGLLGFVGRDAEYLATHISDSRRTLSRGFDGGRLCLAGSIVA